MPFAEKIVHLKHCRLLHTHLEVQLQFEGMDYILQLESPHFEKGKGVVVRRVAGHPISSSFLLWLSVYFGEDFLEPFDEEDTRYSHNRGDFEIDEIGLARFMQSAQRASAKTTPKWKAQLLDNALSYYSAGLRAGMALMPLTMGFFGLSLECIGNLYRKDDKKYYTLGEKRFSALIAKRLRRRKESPKHREATKAIHKRITHDIEIIHILRNAYYGHSFLHRRVERIKLINALRSWYLQDGASNKLANVLFTHDRLDDAVAVVSDGLYKVGLRTNRLVIFMLMGYSRSIPFASHDYKTLGDSRVDEPRTFKGMSLTILGP